MEWLHFGVILIFRGVKNWGGGFMFVVSMINQSQSQSHSQSHYVFDINV